MYNKNGLGLLSYIEKKTEKCWFLFSQLKVKRDKLDHKALLDQRDLRGLQVRRELHNRCKTKI